MTEQDKNLIIRLWESGEPSSSIVRLLPYDTQTAKSIHLDFLNYNLFSNAYGMSVRGKSKPCLSPITFVHAKKHRLKK